jgi:hypothetical protein
LGHKNGRFFKLKGGKEIFLSRDKVLAGVDYRQYTQDAKKCKFVRI